MVSYDNFTSKMVQKKKHSYTLKPTILKESLSSVKINSLKKISEKPYTGHNSSGPYKL